ncbi:MAG: hypothetical protein ACLURP_01945 [Ruminococcus sp.]
MEPKNARLLAKKLLEKGIQAGWNSRLLPEPGWHSGKPLFMRETKATCALCIP